MKELLTTLFTITSIFPLVAQTKTPDTEFLLAGTWVLKAAEVLLPDGTRETDQSYGKEAKGVLIIDAKGNYSLQIFRPDRPKFASGDKGKGTAEEYKTALLGISTHVGQIEMDSVNKTLKFHIDFAAFPNWNGTTQVRNFKLTRDELYYEVPAKTTGGTIAVSVWNRKHS